ncbi:hypothetical protein ASPBRDRAFT_430630 [Aspergillus brasiliensis CBS 101740]|uniref:Uncharacterized protein n=1 Tax=Aspergillus brasiliensis (strain CBS 101740 / IMI 381727 / IBT 21946) TaxID=767769 RepID=A0A1L9U3P5_ASPBC|nr:hypothetical protein ASPBRDRAFT_430630 [Aspergillus brasiliensis CBS 101740]
MNHDPEPGFHYFGLVSQLIEPLGVVSGGLGGLGILESNDIACFSCTDSRYLHFFGGFCVQQGCSDFGSFRGRGIIAFGGCSGLFPAAAAATAAHDLGEGRVCVSIWDRRDCISSCSLVFSFRRSSCPALISWISALADSIAMFWCVMVFFRLRISAQTIWLVMRLLVSSGALKSRGGIVIFCVLLVLPLWAGARVCSPSSLAEFSGVLGVISGSPAGGIAIGPILVSARHTTTVSIEKGVVYSSLLFRTSQSLGFRPYIVLFPSPSCTVPSRLYSASHKHPACSSLSKFFPPDLA